MKQTIIEFTKQYAYILTAVIGLIYFNNWHLLAISLLTTYILWMFAEIVGHDYVEHRYILPKNTVLRYIIDCFIYIVSPDTYADKSSAIKTHLYHHLYWKTDKDIFTVTLQRGIFYFWVGLNPFSKPSIDNMNILLRQYKEFPFIIRYLREIEIILSIIFILLFGIDYYFYIIVLPILFKVILEVQHDYYLLHFKERTYTWLFPLNLNQAWHYEHHQDFREKYTTWGHIFKGPMWVRYINPQYYFVRVFFKLAAK